MMPPPPSSTLFPYTTLFRSALGRHGERCVGIDEVVREERDVGFARQRVGADVGRVVTGIVAALRARILRRRSEEHTSELQSHVNLVCRLLLEKKKKNNNNGQ